MSDAQMQIGCRVYLHLVICKKLLTMQGMSVFISLSSNGLAAHKLMGVWFMFTQCSFTTPPMYHQVLWILKPLYSDHQA
jgi:hypothetical protein